MFFKTSITDLLASEYDNDLKNLYDIKLVNNHFERYIDMLLGNSLNSYSTIFFFNSALPIKMNFGDEYGLSFKKDASGRTTAVISLPSKD